MEEIYKKYNFPGQQKLYQLSKKAGLKVTLKQVDEFLKKQNVSQIYSKKIIQKPGHIVAFNPDERVQMDLVDMSKWDKKNGGYKWIFLFVDIFTRKAFAYLMKNKTEDSIEKILELFFKTHKPNVIITDNEAGFTSKLVQKLMDKNQVYHDTVEIQDHKALGIIDRAVQNIKNAIYKHMKDDNTTKYIDKLPDIIKAYNETPNQGIMDIAPNDASKTEHIAELQVMNHQKDLINKKQRVKYEVGDMVRIRGRQNPFARSYDEKYSDNQYTIVKILDGGRRVELDDGKDVSTRRLVKVAMVAPRQKEVLTHAKHESKVKKAIAREHLSIESKEFKKPSRMMREIADHNPKGNKE